jgi:hypothetical protein
LIQSVLHIHECADPAPTESAAAESAVAVDPNLVESVAVESAAERNHSVADYATNSTAVGAAPIETS